ncbi:hypothetical protein ATCC90586_002913 [Pythium insidiosum]|nr:hypothetical protein ATCC90586_002913 [Pythium insidiosum]
MTLSTSEALALVHALVRQLQPSVPWDPELTFSVVARRCPREPIVVDCRALKLTLQLEQAPPRPQLVGQLLELLDVLSWLSVLPGCSVSENAALWQQIVQLVVTDAIAGETIVFGDAAQFPRWILSFLAEFGEERDCGLATRSEARDRDRSFVQELFAQTLEDAEALSEAYVAAMQRIRPHVEEAASQPPPIPIGIDLDCSRASSRLGFFEQARAFVQVLRANTAPNRIRFDSFGMKTSAPCRAAAHMNQIHEMALLVRENSDVWSPKFEFLGPLLDVETESDGTNDMIAREYREHASILRHLLCEPPQVDLPFSIQFQARMSWWQASCVCAGLRSSSRAIDHFTFKAPVGIPYDEFSWLVYGLFHRSSRASVRLVELWFNGSRTGMSQVGALLSSIRPGEILLRESMPSSQLSDFDFSLVGTRARLNAREFQLRIDFFQHEEARWISIDFCDIPEFEVLATSSRWVGILVPGYGFGWVTASLVERLWTEPLEHVMLPSHSVQDLILRSRCFLQVPALLRAIGAPLRSLVLRSTLFTCEISDAAVDEIIRACPTVTSLELPSIHLAPLVRAYEAGACRVSSLVFRNALGEGPELLDSFVEMLGSRWHVGAATLREVAFVCHLYRAFPSSPFTREAGLDIVTRMTHESRRTLQRLFVARPPHETQLGLDARYCHSEWQQTHGLLSVGGQVGQAIARVGEDAWAQVLAYLGPNRTVRLIPAPPLHESA